MTQIMETPSSLSLLILVIGSMTSMGLSLNMNQIITTPNDVKRMQTSE